MTICVRSWGGLVPGAVILIGCLSLVSCEASADEKGVDKTAYPPSGVFANWSKAQMDEIFQVNPEQFAAGNKRLVEAGLPELKLQDTDACYSAFYISSGDGTSIVYNFDRKTFESTSGTEIRYMEGWHGKCEYDAGKRLETCTSNGTPAETVITWYPRDNFNDRITFKTMAEYQDFIDRKADPQSLIQSYVSCDDEKANLYPRIQAGKLEQGDDTRNITPILRQVIADPTYLPKFMKVVGKQP